MTSASSNIPSKASLSNFTNYYQEAMAEQHVPVRVTHTITHLFCMHISSDTAVIVESLPFSQPAGNKVRNKLRKSRPVRAAVQNPAAGSRGWPGKKLRKALNLCCHGGEETESPLLTEDYSSTELPGCALALSKRKATKVLRGLRKQFTTLRTKIIPDRFKNYSTLSSTLNSPTSPSLTSNNTSTHSYQTSPLFTNPSAVTRLVLQTIPKLPTLIHRETSETLPQLCFDCEMTFLKLGLQEEDGCQEMLDYRLLFDYFGPLTPVVFGSESGKGGESFINFVRDDDEEEGIVEEDTEKMGSEIQYEEKVKVENFSSVSTSATHSEGTYNNNDEDEYQLIEDVGEAKEQKLPILRRSWSTLSHANKITKTEYLSKLQSLIPKLSESITGESNNNTNSSNWLLPKEGQDCNHKIQRCESPESMNSVEVAGLERYREAKLSSTSLPATPRRSSLIREKPETIKRAVDVNKALPPLPINKPVPPLPLFLNTTNAQISDSFHSPSVPATAPVIGELLFERERREEMSQQFHWITQQEFLVLDVVPSVGTKREGDEDGDGEKEILGGGSEPERRIRRVGAVKESLRSFWIGEGGDKDGEGEKERSGSESAPERRIRRVGAVKECLRSFWIDDDSDVEE